jgi:hypothetical protein
MKYIAIFLCLAGLAMAAGYNDWQQGAADGLKYGFKMGQAYGDALDGINIAGFNSDVDVYNAWVRQNFGEDTNLLMTKMNAPTDLSKPILISNNTTKGGIVHAIDGSFNSSSKYTTNDANVLPDSVRLAYQAQDSKYNQDGTLKTGNAAIGTGMGDGYLGGV